MTEASPSGWMVVVRMLRLGEGDRATVIYVSMYPDKAEAELAVKTRIGHTDEEVEALATVSATLQAALALVPGQVAML